MSIQIAVRVNLTRAHAFDVTCNVLQELSGLGATVLMEEEMQPVFGAMLDRSASRTRVLQGLILLTAAMYPLLLLNSGFAYILAVYTVYNVFRRLQPAVNTALSVEFAERNGRDYGPIRMMGAIGYTVMMALISFASVTSNAAGRRASSV